MIRASRISAIHFTYDREQCMLQSIKFFFDWLISLSSNKSRLTKLRFSDDSEVLYRWVLYEIIRHRSNLNEFTSPHIPYHRDDGFYSSSQEERPGRIEHLDFSELGIMDKECVEILDNLLLLPPLPPPLKPGQNRRVLSSAYNVASTVSSKTPTYG